MSSTVMSATAGISSLGAQHAPEGDPSFRRGDGQVGVLGGIARRARSRGAMETLDRIAVTLDGGVVGDFRGGMKGKPHRRQVTLIERGDWAAALAEIGADIPWQERRCNLLVDTLDLPQVKGARLRIGADVVLEITCETDPCSRMDAVAPGLYAALLPDWRGGVCTMVVQGGAIAIGDAIRIET
jgi:MOSC domain-containing protein YiiM